MGQIEDMVNSWRDEIEKERKMEELRKLSEIVSDDKPPDCTRCYFWWMQNCPCGYSCCNAACLIIFRPIFEQNKNEKDEET